MKIVVLGPDGAGKSSVIHGLMERLQQQGRTVTMRHLKPDFMIHRRGGTVLIVVDPHGKPLRSALLSYAKISIWLLEEWCAYLSLDTKAELLICDRYYHDLLIDPRRYRYGGWLWVAKLIGKLMPKPHLWVLLDAPSEVMQARKREVTAEETERQRSAYMAFVRKQEKYAIIDASRPLDKVVGDAERAVAEAMVSTQHS
jgi:thymidylate kinase